MASSPHDKTVLLETRVKRPTPGDAPEVGTSTIDDHEFARNPERPWERCTVCRLAESAHTRVPEPYVPTAPRAVRREA